jgi:predicted RecA/RadA family phage recombinase
MINALHVNEKDNVIVVIEDIKKGDAVEYDFEGKMYKFVSLEDIKLYHKMAIEDIKKGEHIVKYGEHIGVAGRDIKIGEHVHTHNVDDSREKLEV